MTSCCPRRRMRWNEATGAIARCKTRSTGYARRCRSVHAWRWICGVKPKPKAGNKPSSHSIVHGLDKPGFFTTGSFFIRFRCELPGPNVKTETQTPLNALYEVCSQLPCRRCYREGLRHVYTTAIRHVLARRIPVVVSRRGGPRAARGGGPAGRPRP